MIVDLNPLPFTKAIYILRWCHAHNVDRAKCSMLLQSMRVKNPDLNDSDWSLDIPDKYMTWFEMEDI
jgi:hypothetical protein